MAKKKKTNVKTKLAPPKGPLEWIYIEKDDSSMRKLYEKLKEMDDLSVEYWEDAGVLEISLTEVGNIDLEVSEEEHVYWVTVSAKGYDASIAAMKKIEEVCGGEFSVDGGE